ncbi:MAG: EAL domain-containing protein [Anaerolineales bacterium]
MIRSPNAEMREYPLKAGKNILGRSPEIDVVIQDDSASRYHAQVSYDPDNSRLVIMDLNSTNGTYVNGKEILTPSPLAHQDRIRVGRHLITVVSDKDRRIASREKDLTKSIVTGDLLIKSIDNYAVLLHDIGYQLVNIPELDRAFTTISETIQRMLGADDCQVILPEQTNYLIQQGVPSATIKEVIQQHQATIFNVQLPIQAEETIPTVAKNKSMMLVPVSIEDDVSALIWVTKSNSPFGFSYESDLPLVIAVSHQVALSIQRHRVEEELLHNAYHDSLTGLANRVMFLDRLKQSFFRAKRMKDYIFAVLFLDIDNFKVINDSLGHAVGDKLLIAFANRLSENLREMDYVSRYNRIARFGGDEFAILLDDIAEESNVLIVANRLNELLTKPFLINGKDVYITTSTGITISTLGYTAPEDMLRDADIAMYRAKEMGKSRVEVYDTVMHNALMSRLALETELRKAIQNEEFHLYYQPIIDLETMRVVGMEALLRWVSDRGVLGPPDFFNALDTSGLLGQIDAWALGYATRDAAKLQKAFPIDPPLFISVNISANFIHNLDTIGILDDVLEKANLNTDSLHLEITERAGIREEEEALLLLKEIRRKGIRLCLDDFGTGYSTLSYLLRFPVASIKIDRSFVNMLTSTSEGYRIIETLKALTTPLGMDLIAEGIETEEQLNLLKKLEIEYGQGFLFSKAVNLDSAIEFIRKNLNQFS